MKMDDYKRTLNDIKCSDEFRAKMEKLLSQPPESIDVSEFEDSVSAVEIVHTKRKWTHFAAVAAAAVVVFGGIGGGTYYHFSNLSEADTGIEESTAEEILKDEVTENSNSFYSGITQIRMSIDYTIAENVFEAGTLPDTVVENISGRLGKTEWNDVSESSAEDDAENEDSNSLILECSGENGVFTLTVFENGVIGVKFAEGSPNMRGFDEYLYDDIADIVGAGLFDYDLTSFDVNCEMNGIEHSLTKEKVSEISGIFSSYSAKTEKNTDEEHKTNDYIWLSLGGYYYIIIDCDGYADIYFNNAGTGRLSASYRVPAEMYTELFNAVQKQYESDTPDVPWAETGWDPIATASVYRYGNYYTYMIGDTGTVVEAVKALDWKQVPPAMNFNCATDRIELYIGGCLSIYPSGIAIFDSYSSNEVTDPVYYDLGSDAYDKLIALFADFYEDDYSADANFKSIIWERITDGTDSLLYSNYANKNDGITCEILTDFNSGEELREVIENCQWEAVDYDKYISSLSNESFTLSGLHFTRSGIVFDEYYTNAFMLVTGDPRNYLDIFERCIAADSDNYDAYKNAISQVDRMADESESNEQ